MLRNHYKKKKKKRRKMTHIIEHMLKQNGNGLDFKARMKFNIIRDQALHRVTTKDREMIKWVTKENMTSPHSKEGGNPLEQDSIRQTTVKNIDGGLHPAMDWQSPSEEKVNRETSTGDDLSFLYSQIRPLLPPPSPPPPPLSLSLSPPPLSLSLFLKTPWQ